MLEMLKSKTGIIDTSKGDGTANTSIVYHAGKIMALHEGDLPYQVGVGAASQSQELALVQGMGEGHCKETSNYSRCSCNTLAS
jgi:carotenoid cleavage dioxygenase